MRRLDGFVYHKVPKVKSPNGYVSEKRRNCPNAGKLFPESVGAHCPNCGLKLRRYRRSRSPSRHETTVCLLTYLPHTARKNGRCDGRSTFLVERVQEIRDRQANTLTYNAFSAAARKAKKEKIIEAKK
jgi:hypothetical protein